MAKKLFTVQLKCPIVVRKTIKADSIDDAVKQANELARQEKGAVPERGWSMEYAETYEVVAVVC